jgi:hypothetical protein
VRPNHAGYEPQANPSSIAIKHSQKETENREMTASLRPQSAEPNWEEVHSLLDKWEKVWNGDKAKFTATYPQWIVDAAGELFAHDICDKWAWNDYVRAAAVIIARHAEAYARAVAAESRKHNWKCVAPENGYYRWQCQNPGCSETAPYPSVLPDSSCAYSAALPVGESPAAAPQNDDLREYAALCRKAVEAANDYRHAVNECEDTAELEDKFRTLYDRIWNHAEDNPTLAHIDSAELASPAAAPAAPLPPTAEINSDDEAHAILREHFRDDRGTLRPLKFGYRPTAKEWQAINYLLDEWDYAYETAVESAPLPPESKKG